MATKVRFEDREFTPKEAAEASGVSTTLQRDWRRREILQAGSDAGWARFSLNDVIRMAVLNRCSQFGLSVKFAANWVAPIALIPVHEALEGFDDVYGGDDLPANCPTHEGIQSGRYIAAVNQLDDDAPYVARVNSIEQLDDFAEKYDASAFFVLDCQKLAAEIVRRSPHPLVHVTVTETSDDKPND